LQQENRDEHDTYGERCQHRGDRNLARAPHDGLTQWLTESDVPLDVFDDDGSIVDENADGQGKSAQGHGVEGLSPHVHEQGGGEDRKGDGGQDNHCQPPVARKSRIISAVSAAAISPPIFTLASAAFTKID